MPPATPSPSRIVVCSRGSALALAQAGRVVADLRRLFPEREFNLKVIRTTGDQMQSASLAQPGESLPRGLFTKELEAALLERTADIAVHSLKDLPTELPEGLTLAATPPRADPREVLLYRDGTHPDFAASHRTPADWSPGTREPYFGRRGATLADLPPRAVVATSSPRRAAQVKAVRPDIEIHPLRGNIGTRLHKLHDRFEFDATVLAAAGLVRLHYDVSPQGTLRLDPRLPVGARSTLTPPPPGILACILEPEQMLPAVGQGALALEIRASDPEVAPLCAALNHFNTFQAILAERAFLSAMGGGCQAPVAAYARVIGHQLELRAASYHEFPVRHAAVRRPVREAIQLGEEAARQLR